MKQNKRKNLKRKQWNRIAFFLFGVLPERIGLVCLVAYVVLRPILVPHVALGLYVGPLSLLGVAAYVLAAISFATQYFFMPEMRAAAVQA